MEVSEEDVDRAVELLQELKGNVSEVSNHVQMIQQRVDDGEINTAKGISFLEVKHQLLLSYLINVTQVAYNKVSGKSIKGEAAINRLVEIRTVLEKMRPVEQKLKYQIDKLIKVASTGLGENDPLRFKPNPGNLLTKLDDDDGSGSSDDEEDDQDKPEKSAQVYRPPKLAAVPYDGDETSISRREKHEESKRKKSLSREIITDLQREIGDAPEEIQEVEDGYKRKVHDVAMERTRYEENYFIRTNPSKREKQAASQMFKNAGLKELTRLGNIGTFGQDGGQDDGGPRKKRKLSGKGKKKKGKAKNSKKKRMK